MKIVVIDDDPTGSQTVHGCPLILSWDIDTICHGLSHESPFLFILANTRSMMPKDAEDCNREICNSIRLASRVKNIDINELIIVSRGDSTLRGHGVLEPLVINEELGPFDATFHVPAFLEGNRTTRNGIHFLEGIPVHKTEFALDSTFGYSNSDLSLWIEEKSKRFIKSEEVQKITFTDLDFAISKPLGMDKLKRLLIALEGNQQVVVDAEEPMHLNVLANALLDLMPTKRFLFRSAASLLNSLANISPKILDKVAITQLIPKVSKRKGLPGLILVGSHVRLASLQLDELLKAPECLGIEIPVNELAEIFKDTNNSINYLFLKKKIINKVDEILRAGLTPVLFTTRKEIQLFLGREKIHFGNFVANFSASIIADLAPRFRYLISKGGVTSLTILKEGLKLDSVDLIGQIMPGLSLVKPTREIADKSLLIVTFPGNLGNSKALLESWKLMQFC